MSIFNTNVYRFMMNLASEEQASGMDLRESGCSTRPEFVSAAAKAPLTGRHPGFGAYTPHPNRQ
ncbi:MAG: hypothetical protein ACLPXT_02730 [Terracidiphilus sp.]